jgi:importin subunit alpha-1
LSNIAAGTPSQISLLFKTRGVMATVVDYARTATWDVRKEAIWTVCNVFTGGNHIHVQDLVDLDGIESLREALDLNDIGLQYRALDAIEQLIRVGDANGKDYRVFIDELGGIEKIEDLQEHTSDKIYLKVVKILDELFGGEPCRDENLVPETNGDACVVGLKSKTLLGSN